jgi:glycosyltransferase involved in cell wall biosynthesis
MRFSVIIPAYNAENTILNTLISVANQTFHDYELIIINDGSTDETDNVIACFFAENSHLTYKYIKTENKGVSSARNTGWKYSTGDYICFLDSDDIWYKNKLIILNHVLSKYNCDFVGHLYQVKHFPHNIDSFQLTKVNIITYLQRNLFQTSCVCLRRTIPMRFDETMSYSEDYDLFLKIVKVYNAYKINIALTQLGRPQLSKGGLSQDRIKMRKGEIKAYTKFCFQNKWFLSLYLVLILWSLIKHFKSLCKL